ncbi:hypothetical protein FQN51_009151 [Onygenales sp. PD_10]|nr:hypothetical protein FQN51_009151 [Onygenales sp. PD_10]
MQGFNMGRYIPPDLEGHTTPNTLHSKHPLGSRARHLHTTGELTVRFEMPFAIWCATCAPTSDTALIGQGVRFNALKKRVGSYYSTPVYSFRMRHPACGGWIEIRTEPRRTEYVVVEGGRRREGGGVERGGYEEDGEVRLGIGAGAGVGGDGEVDAFGRVEGKVKDQRAAMTQRTRMEELVQRAERDWEDPYARSQELRRVFRKERKRREEARGASEALRERMGLGIELLEESEGDRVRAGLVDFRPAGELGAVHKPLFGNGDGLRSAKPGKGGEEETERRGRKRGKVKKKTAEEIARERKAMLQQELSGNTRAVADPFLREDDGVWTPGVKRRKTGAGLVVSAVRGKEKAVGCDGEDDGDAQDKENGNGDGKGVGATNGGASEIQRPASSTPLVGYASSDDSE